MSRTSTPAHLAIFDNLPFIKTQTAGENCPSFATTDFKAAQAFLLSYRNNTATFNAYRRETERFLQWAWYIHKCSIFELKRSDIEQFIDFCQNPPPTWIGLKKVARFTTQGMQRTPNPQWRPFVATVSKVAHRKGHQPTVKGYALLPKSLREIFTVIGSLYQFLIREEYTSVNPILHIRQKSHYFQSHQSKAKVRRLSELQWEYVLETAEIMAHENAEHERTLFIVTILYALYLRISELSASSRWVPTMGDFERDADGLWWFTTVGKGNKKRQITVSDELLQALKRYRLALGLTPLPSPYENFPLIAKTRGKGPITSSSQIRIIVQRCFDRSIARLRQDGFTEDADALSQATVHWLRHTGISEDVKHRPREHVRDDAGHSSSMTTDRYIDIEHRARHASGRRKRIKPQ
jgi:site-specific recombinase XerD